LKTRRVLVSEFLLADPYAWANARSSLQAEAGTMLTGIVQDFARIPNVTVAVLLSLAARADAGIRNLLPPQVSIISTPSGPLTWLENPCETPDSFDATFVIAPESDGVLTQMLLCLQSGRWTSATSLNLPAELATIFSDKKRTSEWLEAHQIPTPTTITVRDPDQIRIDDPGDTRGFNAETPLEWILKPRDGVGCDRVQVVFLSEHSARKLADDQQPEDEWILQPKVSGCACSIGLIGKGNRPAEILLPAEQHIEIVHRTFHYAGGRIPCEAEHADRVIRIAEQVRNALGGFRGYLGIDLIIPPNLSDDPRAVVIEVNPRLCTSYTGYRSLCRLNLAEQMLDPVGCQDPAAFVNGKALAAGAGCELPAASALRLTALEDRVRFLDSSFADRTTTWLSGSLTFQTDGAVRLSNDQGR
jgi:predicted ATP-grasp superfamily ATP-dependent carboligase